MITNARGATNVTANSAFLNGILVSTGTTATAVSVFWGTNDCGEEPHSWDDSFTWQESQSPGGLSYEISDLRPDTYYYYRFMAENDGGMTWVKQSSWFVTSEVWFDNVSDAQFLGLIKGEVNVCRKGTVSSKPLDIHYSIAGTAIPGVEYVELPGVVTIPTGETHATITIQPLPAKEMSKTKTIELEILSGGIKGSPATANIEILVDNLTSWQKSMPITFTGYTEIEPLINFPALIVLQATELGAGFSYNDFSSPPYNDLRFADDKMTPLYFEVDSWDEYGKSYVWVRIPELTSSTTIYAFWGKSNLTMPVCNTNGSVWRENYLAVWHMNDATDHTIQDSTAHRFNGTKMAPDLPLETDTLIGKGQLFDQNYIDLTGINDQTQTYTISMWINGSSSVASLYPLDIESGRIIVGWGSDNAGKIGTFNTRWCDFGTTPSLNNWHHITCVFHLDKVSLFVDGEQYGATLGHLKTSIGGNVALGSRYSRNRNYFLGILDEVRISTTIRSQNWIRTCYQNQKTNNSFNTYGESVSQVSRGTMYVFW